MRCTRPRTRTGGGRTRSRLREAFTDRVDRLAQAWNEIVPDTVFQDKSRLRERILDAAASPPEEPLL
ncbi:hypothetical protein [Streptomyces puniciscabiei]|uniref:hypothetical protein n=1 Tax=Streptomyces puniciscabiei TaxID=164348 RepID=UPI00333112EC